MVPGKDLYVCMYMVIGPHRDPGSEMAMYMAASLPDRTAVYLQCPAVHTADTLQYMECICSGGCKYIPDTLHTPPSAPITLLFRVKTFWVLKGERGVCTPSTLLSDPRKPKLFSSMEIF